jgi:two-component system phosphate regulon sensor histidine kinase PhoR
LHTILIADDERILGALCILLAVLYARAHMRVRTQSADLRKADATIKQMISAVSHEIRTPLTCLSGYTQMMMENEFPRKRQMVYLGIIGRETQRLNNLLSDFLEVRFLEATETVKVRPERIEGLLLETFDLFENREDSHRLVIDVADALPEVNLDARRIRQVLSNLMSNAIKYSPDGGTIRLSAWVQRDRVVVCVQDEGIGIPAKAIPKLFTKFFRVPGEHTSEIPGTGLGLALVLECVRAHGGDTWVESSPNQGSSFYFSLPINPAKYDAPAGCKNAENPLALK